MSGAPKTNGGPLWPVVAGGRCIGHFLHRGKLGIEVFDASDKSLGLFATLPTAADALQQRESSQ